MRNILKTREPPRVHWTEQAFVEVVAAPQTLFLIAPHRTLEIDSPRIAARIEVERAERDLDLGGPAAIVARDADVPDSVPGFVHPAPASRAQKPVAEKPCRVRLEEISRAAVEKGIEDEHEAVVASQRAVALFLITDDLTGLGIVEHHADIKMVAIERNADFGGLVRGSAFVGLLLPEAVCGRNCFPKSLVEPAVELDLLVLREEDRAHRGAHAFFLGFGDPEAC